MINILCSWIHDDTLPSVHFKIMPAPIPRSVAAIQRKLLNTTAVNYSLEYEVRDGQLLPRYISEQLQEPINIHNFFPHLTKKRYVINLRARASKIKVDLRDKRRFQKLK